MKMEELEVKLELLVEDDQNTQEDLKVVTATFNNDFPSSYTPQPPYASDVESGDPIFSNAILSVLEKATNSGGMVVIDNGGLTTRPNVGESRPQYSNTQRSQDLPRAYRLRENGQYTIVLPGEIFSEDFINPKRSASISCSGCGIEFSTARRLEAHSRVYFTEEAVKCNLCDETFRLLCGLNKHSEHQHPGGKSFKCDTCELAFEYFAEWCSHKKNLHKKEQPATPCICRQCGVIYKNSYILKRHQRTPNNGERPLRCNICDAKFSLLCGINKHSLLHVGQKSFKCDFCEMAFEKVYAWNAHRKKSHYESLVGVPAKIVGDSERRKLLKCAECAEQFSLVSEFVSHRKEHEKILSNQEKEKIGQDLEPSDNDDGEKSESITSASLGHYDCGQCGKIFSDKRNLRAHQRPLLNYGIVPLACNVCNVSFHFTCGIVKHGLQHPGGKPFKCSFCEMAFSNLASWRQHRKSHMQSSNGEEQGHVHLTTTQLITPFGKPSSSFGCDTCDAEFAAKSDLNEHIASHTADLPPICDICSMTFSNKKAFRKHFCRFHTEAKMIPKSYKCDTCQKVFTIRESLKRHKLLHTGEKPFKCKVCGKAFTQQPTYNYHMRIHTGERPYICDVCGMGFKVRSRLKIHKCTTSIKI